MTHAGTILGTPAYMAPEQFTGAEVDARADIFALCVALYDALYGERPFAGETFEGLRRAVLAGQVREPSKPPRQLPARIRRTLLKGLRVAPRDRFADIDALIAELAADPGRRWRRIGGTIGVAALAALAAGSLVRGGDRASDLCRGDMIRVQTIWSDARQDQIGRAFIASGAPAAAETWGALRLVFERDLDHWRRSYRDTCEATHVRGEQSPALLDLRMRCLDRHLQELDALAEIFAAGDPQVVARGLDAFAGISAISRCDEPGALMTQRSGPTDPAEAAAVERLRRALIDGEAYARAGRYDEARRRIDELCAEAERREFPPLLAEAYLLRGRVERDLDDPSSAAESLLRALTLARAHDHPDVARDATIDLIGVVDASQPRTGESELLVRLAEAELTATPSAAAHARLLEQRGELRWRQGRYDEAIEQLEASVERTRAIYGDHHPAAARARIRLGRSLWTRGQHERSQEHLERGRATLEDLLGGDHPELAGALRQEGNAYWVTGGYDRALPPLRARLGDRGAPRHARRGDQAAQQHRRHLWKDRPPRRQPRRPRARRRALRAPRSPRRRPWRPRDRARQPDRELPPKKHPRDMVFSAAADRAPRRQPPPRPPAGSPRSRPYHALARHLPAPDRRPRRRDRHPLGRP
ncbi:MAG: tetratricopeptide repeat protein [Nannocystis sp.]|nr:tetratricopeptide repeat protein [Nannocystis sp.]